LRKRRLLQEHEDYGQEVRIEERKGGDWGKNGEIENTKVTLKTRK
jgi:hypothetical protein